MFCTISSLNNEEKVNQEIKLQTVFSLRSFANERKKSLFIVLDLFST